METSVKTLRRQSFGEELANSITHGIGVALSIAALVILVIFANKQGTIWHLVGFSIYGSTLILLYLSSTLYHAFNPPKIKKIFQILDHASIYLLIAGSYTPLTLTLLRGSLGWTLLGIVWVLAIIGIIFEVIPDKRFQYISLLLYVTMGWMLITAINPVLKLVPKEFFVWMLIGGLSYSLGIIFYVWHKLPYHHTIWHLFVLGGSITHFFGMFFYCVKP